MRIPIAYPFLLSSLLIGAELPPENPVNTGYETQRQDELNSEQMKKIKKSATTIEAVKVEDKEPQEEEASLGPSFTLQGVSIQGNTTFKQEQIIPFVKPFVGEKVYTKTLQDIAKNITALYHSKGYITSKCILPQQQVKDGSVTFQIIEDKLGAIVLSGDSAYEYSHKLFAKYFQKLQGKIINADELNTQLQLLTTLPISKITPTLSRVQAGVSNLILNIEQGEQRATLSVDNMGSYYSGEYRSSISGNINNVAGISDMLFISATVSEAPQDFNSISASYRYPIGKNGARMFLSTSILNYQLNPDKVGTDTVFYDGSTSAMSILYEQPLFLFEKTNVWVSLGFDQKSLNSRTLSNQKGEILVNSVDNTSLFSIGTKVDFLDKYKGYNAFSVKFSQAIPNFLNSMTQEDIDRKTRIMEDDPSFDELAQAMPLKYGAKLPAAFNKTYLSLFRKQYLPYEFTANFSFSGEYTPQRIPQAYEYNTGDFGYNLYAGLYHNLGIKYINGGILYSYTDVYDYDQSLNISNRENNTWVAQITASYESLFANLSYQQNVKVWDSNVNNFKFSLGYSW